MVFYHADIFNSGHIYYKNNLLVLIIIFICCYNIKLIIFNILNIKILMEMIISHNTILNVISIMKTNKTYYDPYIKMQVS